MHLRDRDVGARLAASVWWPAAAAGDAAAAAGECAGSSRDVGHGGRGVVTWR